MESGACGTNNSSTALQTGSGTERTTESETHLSATVCGEEKRKLGHLSNQSRYNLTGNRPDAKTVTGNENWRAERMMTRK